jgi:hypothetical protein
VKGKQACHKQYWYNSISMYDMNPNTRTVVNFYAIKPLLNSTCAYFKLFSYPQIKYKHYCKSENCCSDCDVSRKLEVLIKRKTKKHCYVEIGWLDNEMKEENICMKSSVQTVNVYNIITQVVWSCYIIRDCWPIKGCFHLY